MELENRWLRETYVDLLMEYAQKDERLVLVEADLMLAAGTKRFAEKYPERTFDVGIAEANMIGVAAGMAAMGKIPFTHTFTPFSTRRVCDQVTLSVAYAKLNVKMMGSDPGVTAELNGGTHMSMEDVAIMRNIPGMTVFEPTDSAQLKKAFPQIMYHDGPVYIRLLRRNAVRIFEDDCEFQLGKGIVLKTGRDVTLVASGIMVAETMEAGRLLGEKGIDAEIINIHTVKPLDTGLLLESARKTGAVVTAENHTVINGLGSAVADCLSEHFPVPLQKVGVKDHFGEVGLTEFLKEKYGLKARNIVEAAEKAIAMKDRRKLNAGQKSDC
ncbi:transketolase family protein [Caproiciproducens sp. CPB-2]|uniref:transketolase family protein n=1 Tax=Caproiciproducens sp. CPB-2 TaxID=3030017 RepID=UPI0023D98775|nr:transketolase C-terminal domain-containing protein [Caproiciproducens sp. CPB-2]MDF1495316.1 transketolase C-terminal domain-containing protein [Caproiciproducens sp. CPB-2]